MGYDVLILLLDCDATSFIAGTVDFVYTIVFFFFFFLILLLLALMSCPWRGVECGNTAMEKCHNTIVSRKLSGTGSCIYGWTHMYGWNTPAKIFHVLHVIYLNPPLDIYRQASRNNYVNIKDGQD